MEVFVINQHGEALMPCTPRKARLLLKSGKAKVVRRNPFTIQLKYGSTGYKQNLTLGVDTGHSEVGLSVVSETKEVFSAVAKMRNDISEKMDTRRMYRRQKRNRLRYRKPRFNNCSASTIKGGLAPSVQWIVDAHTRMINQFKSLLPITKLVLETGLFDMAKMKNPKIRNKQYQKGVQYGFENTKAYVLSRDSHQCQSKKKGCSNKLEVHHIKYRSQGGSDAPNNLITLCQKHHKALHGGKLKLNIKSHKSLKSATTMNVIRKRLLEIFPDAIETFGYITKANRYQHGIEKTHSNDAFIIAGGTIQKRAKERTIGFKRKNNRCLQKNRNGYAPAIRRQRYKIQPKDLVKFEGKQYQAVGIQNKGAYLKMTDGVNAIVKSMKKIEVVFHQKGLVYE
jgi:5-methylcytosine-specific restriction endonuclease McrA